jgi:hypothetical protein
MKVWNAGHHSSIQMMASDEIIREYLGMLHG